MAERSKALVSGLLSMDIILTEMRVLVFGRGFESPLCQFFAPEKRGREREG